jgi:hypothetical protein
MVLHAVVALVVAFVAGVVLRPTVAKLAAKFDSAFIAEVNAAKLKVLTEVTKVEQDIKSKL